VRLTAKRAGDAYVQEIPVEFPESDAGNTVLPSLWARAKVENLMSQDLGGMQQQQMKPALEKEITQLGLNYRLMTQFTSFVAVEEKVTNVGGQPRTVQVPVELPEGV
jgi:Ca-activated chloride channel family protein